jgi:hypothetical protein
MPVLYTASEGEPADYMQSRGRGREIHFGQEDMKAGQIKSHLGHNRIIYSQK